MDNFVNQVAGHCLTESWDEAAEATRKAARDVLGKSGSLDGALESLPLDKHSIPVAAILSAKLRAASTTDHFDAVLSQISDFTVACDIPQMRHAVDIYCDLFRRLAEQLVKRRESGRGIGLLRQAVERLGAPGELTPLHGDLCLLCLDARHFRPALRVLDADVSILLKETSKAAFPAKAFLLYYYYGGMIYAARRNYARALFFFEVAVTTPCTAVSAIMVEAYKAHILVSLIQHGKVVALPKYTSSVVNRFVKPAASAFHELATAYASSNPAQLKTVADKHWINPRDQMSGLVRLVVRSLYKRNIQRLTRSFLTLSLSDVAGRAFLSSGAEAEEYLVAMVADGEIFARIDQAQGMVHFLDDPNTFSRPEDMASLEAQVSSTMRLGELVRGLDAELSVSPLYVQRVSKSGAGGAQDDEGVSVSAPGPAASLNPFSDFLGIS